MREVTTFLSALLGVLAAVLLVSWVSGLSPEQVAQYEHTLQTWLRYGAPTIAFGGIIGWCLCYVFDTFALRGPFFGLTLLGGVLTLFMP